MGASKHIKIAMTDKEKKAGEIAEMIGLPAQTFYNKLSRDTMKFDDVEKIADLLGCDVVLRDRESGKFY